MRFGACPREREVTEMLGRGQWPQGCGDEIRAHVAGCRSCRELVLVRQAFGHERMQAAGEARLDSPGAIWWRAQLRRRNAAIERIGRPLLGAQIFALAVCLVAAIVYVLWMTRRGFDWLAWLGELPRALHLGALVPGSLSDSPWTIWLGLSAGALVALTGGLLALLKSEKR
jgi:hypothetical protein